MLSLIRRRMRHEEIRQIPCVDYLRRIDIGGLNESAIMKSASVLFLPIHNIAALWFALSFNQHESIVS